MRPPTRLNRTLLGLLGLVLLAAGAAALTIGLGVLSPPWLPVGPATALLPSDPAVPTWAPYAATAAGAVVAPAALAWLLAQARPRRSGPPWRAADPQGATTVRPSVIADAVAADVAACPGVRGARATLVGPRERPELHLVVAVAADSALAAVRERVTGHALPRLRRALDLDVVPTELELRPQAGVTRRTLR
jgi:hypothetical protein